MTTAPTCATCGQPVRASLAGLSLYPEHSRVRIGEWEERLTPNQFSLLQALVAAEGGTVSHGDLLAVIGNFTGPPRAQNILKVYICYLRRRLKPHGLSVACVWGTGYRLVEYADAQP